MHRDDPWVDFWRMHFSREKFKYLFFFISFFYEFFVRTHLHCNGFFRVAALPVLG
jgi:hypothetical protein